MAENDGEDYRVGPGRPPKHSRFKPGRSGNPSGRPKKRHSIDELFMAEAESIVTAKSAGKTIRLTKIQAVMKGLLNKAASGHAESVKYVLREYRKSHAVLEQARKAEPQFSWSEEEAELLNDIDLIRKQLAKIPTDQ